MMQVILRNDLSNRKKWRFVSLIYGTVLKACSYEFFIIQGPVVQSVVSLTSSLRVISLTVFADSIYNILIFFAEKM